MLKFQEQRVLSQEQSNVEKKMKTPFKRAATHVAIAYFIYLKSFDYNSLSKLDKSKMDPTYNARLLKEKKYEMYAAMGDENLMQKNIYGNYDGRLMEEDEQQQLNAVYEQYQKAQFEHQQQLYATNLVNEQIHHHQQEELEQNERQEAEEEGNDVDEDETPQDKNHKTYDAKEEEVEMKEEEKQCSRECQH